jgi:antitoxin HicB
MSEKNLEYYLSLPYTIEVIPDKDEDGQVTLFARVVELPGCMTEADDFTELGEMIEDAKISWLETALEDGQPIPEPRPIEGYSGKFVVRVPKSTHRELAEAAERDGVSLNTFVNVALGRAIGSLQPMAVEPQPDHILTPA